jgi:Ca-activated chloride channel homolog
MNPSRYPRFLTLSLVSALGVLCAGERILSGQQRTEGTEGFRFRTGVELINVTATVIDSAGRFVSGLRKEDFLLYEDDEPRDITHFSNERVPVSLGIAVDTSGSMAGEKMIAAQNALDRFLFDLLDPEDEIFLYRFSSDPVLVHDWTTDRDSLHRAIGRLRAAGGTAMYDAVAEAVPIAQAGRNGKKAVLIISDGNDTSSRTDVRSVRYLIRETEVLVYAIGIDGRGEPRMTGGVPPRLPIPIPLPIPGRHPRSPWPVPGPGGPGRGGGRVAIGHDDRVNVAALREMTDESGGRTEIIRAPRDLDPATGSIADELSKQYYLGYPAKGFKDGRWHSIRVEVKDRNYRVRHRRGYVATP